MLSKKTFALAVLVLVAVSVLWICQVKEEISKLEILPDQTPAIPSISGSEQAPDSWDINHFRAFFIEYRLQRDRVRAGELEILNRMMDNPNVSAEGKREAEEQMLVLVKVMEKELIIENMLKAQGYKDAVFFFHQGVANVVVDAEQLTDTQFLQIAEMVSGVTGVKIEDVTVVEHQSR
jgi:stage III sporulation protein AH